MKPDPMYITPNNKKYWIVETVLKEVHCYPKDDKAKHTLSPDCSCEPEKEYADDIEVPCYIHQAFDGRELFEELRKRGIKGI